MAATLTGKSKRSRLFPSF